MENKIKELIEKWEKERLDRVGNEGGDASSDSYFVINDMIADLKAVLKLYQSQQNGIKEVYERFKHLDRILSDPMVKMPGKKLDEYETCYELWHETCYELWEAVKNANIKNKTIGK